MDKNKKPVVNSNKKGILVKIVLIVLALLLLITVVLAIVGARGIHLRSETVVSLTPEQSWEFFQDPHNLAKWDRSVAKVEITSPDPNKIGLGYTFDTIAPPQPGQNEGMRMSYKVTEFVPGQYAKISLQNSPMFEKAVWGMILEPAPEGTRVISTVDFIPKLQYSFLVPVILVTSKNALGTDMDYLKAQMESYAKEHEKPAGTPSQ